MKRDAAERLHHDSKTIRRTAETLLSKAGCEVITATDGFDALAKIADSQPAIRLPRSWSHWAGRLSSPARLSG